MFIIYAFTLVVLLLITNYKWKRRRLEKMMRQFDGPPLKPILGNGLDFLGDPTDVLHTGDAIWAKYPSPCRIWILHKPYILIYSPEDFQIVVNSTLEKDDSYQFFVDMLGDGVFTLTGERWKSRRKLLKSTFNPISLQEFLLDIFNRQSKILRERLSKEMCSGKHFDVWPYFIENSIETISRTALGCRGDDLQETEDVNKFAKAVMKSARVVAERFYKPWLYPTVVFTLYKKLKGYGGVFDTVHNYPLQLLEARRRQTEKKKKNQKEPKNFLDTLQESYEHNILTDEDIKNEVISIYFGGSETNAVTSSFLLLMLALRQDIQEGAYQEQYGIFGDIDRNVDLVDVAKMTLLERLIKETLRLFTVVSIVARYAYEDIPISNHRVIPAGSNVVLCIRAIHHDHKIYPDPLTWNPDNFTPEKEASRHKCSFVPFSSGSRGCMGMKYAMVALKIQFSVLLRAYKVSTDVKMEDIELEQDVILRSKKGYEVLLERRK